MSEDSVNLNATPAPDRQSVEKVASVLGPAAPRAISENDDRGEAFRRALDARSGARAERKGAPAETPPDADGTFAELEVGVESANGQLREHGLAVILRLEREEGGEIHLEIEDHRAVGAAKRRIRLIEPDAITPLINDLLGQAGICLDRTA